MKGQVQGKIAGFFKNFGAYRGGGRPLSKSFFFNQK